MKLKKLTLDNIRSYDREEITFPEGSTLLSGDIGSGKTSILLSIEYALFGLQPGQRGSALLANGKDYGGVILEFEVNGKEIVLERKLKRGSKTVNQDSASIAIDGERTESSVTEIKTKVLELLSYPQEFVKKNNLLYRYTVYTPQEEMKQIILEDSESRMNILRHIFGIDKYKRIKENLAMLTSKLREEARILQVEIRGLDEAKSKLEIDRKFLSLLENKTKSKIIDLEKVQKEKLTKEQESKELEEKIKEKEIFAKEIEKTNISLVYKKDRLISDENSIKELEIRVSQIKYLFNEEEFLKVTEKIKDKKTKIDEANKDLIELSGKINSLSLKRQEDLEKKNRIFKIDICPTCLQDVSDTHKTNILNDTEVQLSKSENKEKELKDTLISLIKVQEAEKTFLSEQENKRSELILLKLKTEEIKKAKEKILELEKSRETFASDIKFLEGHVQNLKESSLEFSKYENLFKIKQEELKAIFQKERQTEIEMAELKKETEMTEKEILEFQKKIMETEKIKERLIKTLEIESWLSGDFLNLVSFTEKNIMLTLREEFSKLFNKWFSLLTTDAFYVNLDENFAPVITQGDFELDYSYLSGGERTAVALAYRLALNQTLNSLLSKIQTRGLVILDEPTDGFSDQQLNKVRDIFKELEVNQLILVSHEQKIESFVDNVIRFKKESGISRKE